LSAAVGWAGRTHQAANEISSAVLVGWETPVDLKKLNGHKRLSRISAANKSEQIVDTHGTAHLQADWWRVWCSSCQLGKGSFRFTSSHHLHSFLTGVRLNVIVSTLSVYKYKIF
jgi:hypothetical protein